MTPWALRHYAELASTQDEAKALISAGEVINPTWIMADWQTQGRGRLGRVWHARPGNYTVSLILPWEKGPASAPQMSLVTALALLRVFSAWNLPHPILKWPNDVLLDGGKVAGILLEFLAENLIIGVGVNLNHAPDETLLRPGGIKARTLDYTKSAPEFHKFFEASFQACYETYCQSGFSVLRDEISSYLWAPQKLFHINAGEAHLIQVRAIDEDGALLVEREGKIERIVSGELRLA